MIDSPKPLKLALAFHKTFELSSISKSLETEFFAFIIRSSRVTPVTRTSIRNLLNFLDFFTFSMLIFLDFLLIVSSKDFSSNRSSKAHGSFVKPGTTNSGNLCCLILIFSLVMLFIRNSGSFGTAKTM